MTRKVIAAMRISSFFYSIKQGIKNIWRNKMFSVASIATMCACIFLFGLFYSIVENFQSMVKEAEEGVAVSVFFNEGISQEQIDEIGNKISKRVKLPAMNLFPQMKRGKGVKRHILVAQKKQQRDLRRIHLPILPVMKFI